jgi:hypothetical protein
LGGEKFCLKCWLVDRWWMGGNIVSFARCSGNGETIALPTNLPTEVQTESCLLAFRRNRDRRCDDRDNARDQRA